MTYIDVDGVSVDAQQLTDPTVINTVDGEVVGECGQWLVSLPDSKPALISNDVFLASFTKAQ